MSVYFNNVIFSVEVLTIFLRFLARYLMLFESIVSGIFLNFIFILLLAYKNKIDFLY